MLPTPPPISVHIESFQASPESATVKKHLKKPTNGPVLYTIVTTHLKTSYTIKRRFHDFYVLRKNLLAECSSCKTCEEYAQQLREIPFPSRNNVVNLVGGRLSTKQLQARADILTAFLRNLIDITATGDHPRAANKPTWCRMNGKYLCSVVGMFLGLKSLLRFSLAQTDCEALVKRRAAANFNSQNNIPSLQPLINRIKNRPRRSASSPQLFRRNQISSSSSTTTTRVKVPSPSTPVNYVQSPPCC